MSKEKMTPTITNLRNISGKDMHYSVLDIKFFHTFIPYDLGYVIIENSLKLAETASDLLTYDAMVMDMVFDIMVIGGMTNVEQHTVFKEDTGDTLVRMFEFYNICERIGLLKEVRKLPNYQTLKGMMHNQATINLNTNNSLAGIVKLMPKNSDLKEFGESMQGLVSSLNILADFTHPTEDE